MEESAGKKESIVQGQRVVKVSAGGWLSDCKYELHEHLVKSTIWIAGSS